MQGHPQLHSESQDTEGDHMDHGHHSMCPTVARTTDTNMFSGSSMDHGHLWRRPRPENEPCYISDILSLLKARVKVLK